MKIEKNTRWWSNGFRVECASQSCYAFLIGLFYFVSFHIFFSSSIFLSMISVWCFLWLCLIWLGVWVGFLSTFWVGPTPPPVFSYIDPARHPWQRPEKFIHTREKTKTDPNTRHPNTYIHAHMKICFLTRHRAPNPIENCEEFTPLSTKSKVSGFVIVF